LLMMMSPRKVYERLERKSAPAGKVAHSGGAGTIAPGVGAALGGAHLGTTLAERHTPQDGGSAAEQTDHGEAPCLDRSRIRVRA
jgi:hypothetical protein